MIFSSESELWRLRFGVNCERHIVLPVPGPAPCHGHGSSSVRETSSNIILLSTIVTFSQIKFTLKC